MNTDEVLKASLATILYIRGVFSSDSYTVSFTPDGAPYMRFLSGNDGVSLVCDWIVSSKGGGNTLVIMGLVVGWVCVFCFLFFFIIFFYFFFDYFLWLTRTTHATPFQPET